MKRKYVVTSLMLLTILVAIAVSASPTAHAQSGGPYTLTWSTVPGGGGMFSTDGKSYSLGGTIGQFDLGAQSGGTYTQSGGFWNAFQSLVNLYYYLPVILKNAP